MGWGYQFLQYGDLGFKGQLGARGEVLGLHKAGSGAWVPLLSLHQPLYTHTHMTVCPSNLQAEIVTIEKYMARDNLGQLAEVNTKSFWRDMSSVQALQNSYR